MSRELLLPAVFLVVRDLANTPDFRLFRKLEMKGGKANAISFLFVVAISQHDPTMSLVSVPIYSLTSQTDGDAVSRRFRSMPGAGQCRSLGSTRGKGEVGWQQGRQGQDLSVKGHSATVTKQDKQSRSSDSNHICQEPGDCQTSP